MTGLSLDPVVRAYYTLAPISQAPRTLNVGAIITNSVLITTEQRVVIIQNAQELLDMGFSTGSREYQAALIYFAASSVPTRLAVIRVVLDTLSGTATKWSWQGLMKQGDEVKIDEQASIVLDLPDFTNVKYQGPLDVGNTVSITYDPGTGPRTEVYTISADNIGAPLNITLDQFVSEMLNKFNGDFQILGVSPGSVSLMWNNPVVGANEPVVTVDIQKATGPDVGTVVSTIGDAGNITEVITYLKKANLSTTSYIIETGEAKLEFQNEQEGPNNPEYAISILRDSINLFQPGIIYGTFPDYAENYVTALADARDKSNEWYAFTHLSERTPSELAAMASFAEGTTIATTFFGWTSDSNALSKDLNVISELKAFNYRKTKMDWYADYKLAVANMGYAMGQMKKTAGSSFTLALKVLPSVTTSDLTSQQVSNIQNSGGNVYVNREGYSMYEPGKVLSGDYYDEIIQLDSLAIEVKTAVANILSTNPKIAQTEAGMNRIKSAIGQVAATYVTTGFLAPGPWSGPVFQGITTGQILSLGYLVLSDSILAQPQADREARKAPNIYLLVKLAGAIQSAIIEIPVSR